MQAESECRERERGREREINKELCEIQNTVEMCNEITLQPDKSVDLSLYTATMLLLMLQGVSSWFRNLHFTLVPPFYFIFH